MKERQQDIARTAAWAVDRLAARVGSAPESIHDDDYGSGSLLSAPDALPCDSNDRRFVALYPDTRVVAISSKNVDITIRNALVREARSGIHIETADGSARVLFLKDGHIALEVLPPPLPEPLESPTGIPTPQNAENIVSDHSPAPEASGDEIRASGAFAAPRDGEVVAESSSKAQRALEAKVATAREKQRDKEKQPVLRIAGNLVHDPVYTTPKDGPAAINLVVAEHVPFEGERVTIYHRIYTTNTAKDNRADKIRDMALTKGDAISLTGAFQLRTVTRNGKPVTEPRIYAYGIKRSGGSEPGANAAGSRRGDA